MDIITEAKEALAQHEPMDAYSHDLIGRLVDRLESQRLDTINEIINKYHKEMIRFYEKEQKTNPNIGRYAHEHDIKIHERMIEALEKQEWLLLPPVGDK